MKYKIFIHISYFTIALTIACVGYLSFLLLYPVNHIDVKQPMAVDKKVYRIGDTVTYTIDFCKYNNYEIIDLKRFLVNGYLYPLPNDLQNITDTPIGCHKADVHVPLIVPDTIEDAKAYTIKVVIVRKVNFIRTETETYVTEPFKIIK
jgi:hypothetical protein